MPTTGPTGAESTLLWGLTWANVIAFVGIVVNLLWNWRNSRREKKTRRNTLALDHFSESVRGPLGELTSALGAHMDAADDIDRLAGPLETQIAAVAELRKAFHATRRTLARTLTDYDASSLVEGTEWAALEAQDMDNATDALDDASRANDTEELHKHLLEFARRVDALRTRLTGHLDNCAQKLMR